MVIIIDSGAAFKGSIADLVGYLGEQGTDRYRVFQISYEQQKFIPIRQSKFKLLIKDL